MLFQSQFDNITHTDQQVRWVMGVNYGSYVTRMLDGFTDGELIKEYVDNGNDKSFETLMQRHYDKTYKRFLKHCRDPDNAADLSQKLWLLMVINLKRYHDDGKFPEFLMRCSTNLLTDFWRRKGVKDKVIDDTSNQAVVDPIETALDNHTDTEKSSELQEQIHHLTNDLIPALPCEQRLVFLLKHESEYWEYKHRLNWHHLATLNNVDEETAWKSFEDTRNALMSQMNGTESDTTISCEDSLIFMVWTQAQRPHKQHDFTWKYFSKSLNIPENTLKTRYRAALSSLSKGLTRLNTNG